MIRAFGEDTERYAVMQGLHGLVHRLVVMAHLLQSVPYATDRHDLQPIQDLRFLGVAEDIGAGDKDFLLVVDTKDAHRVA